MYTSTKMAAIMNTSLNSNGMTREQRLSGVILRSVLLISLVGIVACDQTPTSDLSSAPVPTRVFDPAQIELGAKVFKTHCQICHGEQAQGHPQWRKPGADGKYPPPPLDGSGHAWHHSRAVLKQSILKGSIDSMGNMPAMAGILNDQELEAVISFIQSLWSDQVYAAWYQMQQQK